MVSFDDMTDQFGDGRGLPVARRGSGGSSAVDLGEDGGGIQSLSQTGVFEGTAASAAIIEAVLFENADGMGRSGGEIGESGGDGQGNLLLI